MAFNASIKRAILLALFCRQLYCQLSLFAISSVLMDNALTGCLINGAYSVNIGAIDSGLVIGSQSLIKALNGSLNLRSDHAVAKILLLADAYALQSGLMVSQNNSPPVFFTRTECIISHELVQCKLLFCGSAHFPQNIVSAFTP